ncbi:MAG: hypothetical protein M5U28_23335 [Sandaracinaceae bacterium]|nr:hypothetical protein [Sandaracinaceae bacterium]
MSDTFSIRASSHEVLVDWMSPCGARHTARWAHLTPATTVSLERVVAAAASSRRVRTIDDLLARVPPATVVYSVGPRCQHCPVLARECDTRTASIEA